MSHEHARDGSLGSDKRVIRDEMGVARIGKFADELVDHFLIEPRKTLGFGQVVTSSSDCLSATSDHFTVSRIV
jgi:hypothetical protein